MHIAKQITHEKKTRRIHDKNILNFGETLWSFKMHVCLHAIKMHLQQDIC